MEGDLSTLAIIAVAAGIGIGLTGDGGELFTGKAAFAYHYSSWEAAAGLGSKLETFINGSANIHIFYSIGNWLLFIIGIGSLCSASLDDY